MGCEPCRLLSVRSADPYTVSRASPARRRLYEDSFEYGERGIRAASYSARSAKRVAARPTTARQHERTLHAMSPTRIRAPRTAFVLAGGASLGAMQVGMLRALYEHGIVPDILVGTSAGALNAAFISSRPQSAATAEELASAWCAMRREQIFPLAARTLLWGLASRHDHLVPDRGLRRLVERHMQFERLEQAAIELQRLAFDVLAGREVLLSRGPVDDALVAAAAIPGVFSPVRWGSVSWSTAGWSTTHRSRMPSSWAPNASTCCRVGSGRAPSSVRTAERLTRRSTR